MVVMRGCCGVGDVVLVKVASDESGRVSARVQVGADLADELG